MCQNGTFFFFIVFLCRSRRILDDSQLKSFLVGAGVEWEAVGGEISTGRFILLLIGEAITYAVKLVNLLIGTNQVTTPTPVCPQRVHK